MRFQNKIAVVTGGANGIGRAIAEAFFAEGAYVAVIDTDAAAGRRLAARYPERTLFFTGDVADKEALDAFADAVVKRFHHVDYVIHNACVSRGGIRSGCDYNAFDYCLRVGAVAPYYLTRALLPYFQPGAAIVHICSTRAFMSQPDTESYSATKGAIAALTHALAASLSGRVRVNAISPGWIDTGAYHDDARYASAYAPADTAQHPAGRVGVPEDIAAMALYLCSAEAGFITGQNMVVDGGMTRLMIYHGDHGWTYDEPAAWQGPNRADS